MAESIFDKNKQKAKQVLILYSKLLAIQQSSWSKLLQFQKSQLFQSFNRRFRLKDILQIRLDDLIFLVLLGSLICLFQLIASDPQNLLYKSYRTFCIFLFICSSACLFIKPTIKYLCLFFVCFFYPAILLATYQGAIASDSTANVDIYQYMGYLSLGVVYIFLLLVFPLKNFITQLIGSLYGYLYGLSVLTLLGLWPFYSVIEQLIAHSTITTSIITFIVIIVFSFYLMVHKIFFQGDKQMLLKMLKSLFRPQQLNQCLNSLSSSDIQQYQNFTLKTRLMSLTVLTTTLGLQLYIFFIMGEDLENMIRSLALMVFALFFLLLGTVYIAIPLKNKFAIPIFCLISLTPAGYSFLYSQKFMYYEYLFTMLCIPYTILFWSVVRAISKFKPLFQIRILTILYLFIHIPIMIFVMDVFNYFGSGYTISPIGYIAMFVVLGTIVLAGGISTFQFFFQLFSMQRQQKKNTCQLDFVYQQVLDYRPYKKLNNFTFEQLASVDLSQMGRFLCSLFFLISITISFYCLNQLLYVYSPSYFYSPTIYQLTYCQFAILVCFYLYGIYYISTNNTQLDTIIAGLWAVVGLAAVAWGYITQTLPDMYRIFGGFCLLMTVFTLGFKYIKETNPKITKFICPMLIICIWIVLVIPYVVLIPSLSIFVDQSHFGQFIYDCILSTILLIIVLVGIVSMIFNMLMNKFQQQKRYKYVIEDVKQFFDDQGIQANDEVLHVFHQAYQSRNKQYMFYMKNGYPINVTKDQDNDGYKLATYDDVATKMTTTAIMPKKQIQVDHCWNCLTFFCGEDQDDIDKKLENAISSNLINEQQAQTLMPTQKFINPMLKHMLQKVKIKQVHMRPQDVHSTKSLLMNSLSQGNRILGPQYTLLKMKKQYNLALQIWDSIFNFISNNDQDQKMVIFNDFNKFCQITKLQIYKKDFQQLFHKYAKSSWKDTVALSYQQFAIAIQDIAHKCYEQYEKIQQANQNQLVIRLLIEKVYYNLAKYQQFQELRRNSSAQTFQTKYSGFKGSYIRYKQSQKQRQKQVQNYVKYIKKQRLPFADQNRHPQQKNQQKKQKKLQAKQQYKEHQISCKKRIHQQYLKSKDCCSKNIVEEKKIIKKQKIKPWAYLASQSVKILHRKSALWEDQHQAKQYQFRPILNNIFMAIFKLSDLYAYLQITLNDSQVQWFSGAKFSFLYIDYKYQLYACLALIFITVPLGLKGISFIFEDRLGLTEARVPAGFPHPMFFYTVIYKLLVLSLFGIISSTLLVTFSCTWTQSSPFKLYSDNSIQCLSTQHNIYMLLSLVFLIVYFPLSSYTFPNFQFSQKCLDLKYRPSYLVLYFQINFVLSANKVLLSLANDNSSVEQAFISINIVSLLFLAIVCLRIKPCLIEWFNWIEFLTIVLGLIWNIGGLVLYLTKYWAACVVACAAASLLTILIVLYIIKKYYFSSDSSKVQNDDDQIRQLKMSLQYKQQRNRLMLMQRSNKQIDLDKIQFVNTNQNKQKQNILVQNILQETQGKTSVQSGR